ncbi:hypothetical protein XalbCFBP2523_12930 [Xanthomonas albilineans]|nr:hypothetical protein XalbCFBP2523_12930 [Xanthomonas albilineans]
MDWKTYPGQFAVSMAGQVSTCVQVLCNTHDRFAHGASRKQLQKVKSSLAAAFYIHRPLDDMHDT